MLTQVDLLKKHNIAVRGHVGQHLLIDPNLQRKTVELLDLKKTDSVIEIGPGLGALTSHLIGRCKQILLIEMDPKFSEILAAEYPDLTKKPNQILNRDVLKTDFDEILDKKKKYKVLSNLPYYITAPILFHLLESREYFTRMVFTMQKEVASRLIASPGSKDYGRLSLGIRYAGHVEHAFDVPPTCFTPRPAVASSVVTVDLHPDEKLLPAKVEKTLFHIIKVAFSQRRKIFISLLAADSQTGWSKEKLKALFAQLQFPETVRGEQLLLKDYIALAEALVKK